MILLTEISIMDNMFLATVPKYNYTNDKTYCI